LFLEVLEAEAPVTEASEALATSEAWWTKMNMSLIATPIYEVASEGAKEVVIVDSGDVAAIVSRSPVTVCSPKVHVPDTMPKSPGA
jgi:hypothetical protein